MLEQDYIMRLIKEIVRAILKLLFNIDTDQPTVDLLEDERERNTLNNLLDMIDSGNINEAENQLYSLASGNSPRDLQMALLFYSYLNDKSDDFLEEHEFSRDEIKLGIKIIAKKHGLSGMVDAFFTDV